jgi:HK97 family phage major capsid protein
VTTAIPETSDGLEDLLSSSRMSDLFEADGPDKGKPKAAFGELVKAYVDKTRKVDPGLQAQVEAEVQRVNAEWLRDNTAKVKRLDLTNGPDAGRNPKAPGACLDKLRMTYGDFFEAAWHKQSKPDALARRAEIVNSYGTVVPDAGGFLVPETLRAQLLQVALETAVTRSRAMVVPMDSLRVPFPIIDSTSNASSIFGGLTAYWTEESAALTESQTTFGRVVLDAKKLTVYGQAPNEVFQDSIISFEAFIAQALPQAITWFEDVGFMSGTGVGEPLGWLTAKNAAAVSVAKETGQASASIVWENIVKAWARLLPSSMGKAVWVANNDTFPELATMALSVGTGGAPIWLNNGTVGPPMSILGRPVVFTEKCPTLGQAGDINLVDLSYYLIGDRQSMQADTSPHYKFANDQTVFRVIERVDGRPWLQSAITPQQGSNTLSPFVKVAVR